MSIMNKYTDEEMDLFKEFIKDQKIDISQPVRKEDLEKAIPLFQDMFKGKRDYKYDIIRSFMDRARGEKGITLQKPREPKGPKEPALLDNLNFSSTEYIVFVQFKGSESKQVLYCKSKEELDRKILEAVSSASLGVPQIEIFKKIKARIVTSVIED